jgi:hypothetical protein
MTSIKASSWPSTITSVCQSSKWGSMTAPSARRSTKRSALPLDFPFM